MNRRKSFAKGTFYPADPEEIKRIFDGAVSSEEIEALEGEIYGGVVPHAGYVYCANIGIHLFEDLRRSGKKWDTVIIINPNHTGYGQSIEGDNSSHWKSPLGEVEIDHELLDELGVEKGDLAQKFEHSAEVIVPYLKYFLKDEFKVAPICMMNHTYKEARSLAERIFETTHKNKRVLVLASSDFTHFKTREEGRRLDDYALESLLKLDSMEFFDRVMKKDISICGLGPIMVLIEYLKLKAKKPEIKILARGDSGEINNQDHVVDYISLVGIDKR